MYRRILKIALPLLLITLVGCSRYTAPSPIDGAWRMERIVTESDLVFELPEGATPYWNIMNVVYSVGLQRREGGGVQQTSRGNVFFHRDKIRFVPDQEHKRNFPVPDGQELEELTLRYQVWKDKLVFYGEGYTIYLIKR